jgi:hypothetical protein
MYGQTKVTGTKADMAKVSRGKQRSKMLALMRSSTEFV